MESKRFKTIRSKLRNSTIIFDKLTEEPIVEIASNNRQLNDFMAKACMTILSCDSDFLKMVEKW